MGPRVCVGVHARARMCGWVDGLFLRVAGGVDGRMAVRKTHRHVEEQPQERVVRWGQRVWRSGLTASWGEEKKKWGEGDKKKKVTKYCLQSVVSPFPQRKGSS